MIHRVLSAITLATVSISSTASASSSNNVSASSTEFSELPQEVQRSILDDLAIDDLEEGRESSASEPQAPGPAPSDQVSTQAEIRLWPKVGGGWKTIGEGETMTTGLWFLPIRDAMTVGGDLVEESIFTNATKTRVEDGMDQVRLPRLSSRENGPWHLYKIYYQVDEMEVEHYKYGITRQRVPDQRPRAQLKTCREAFKNRLDGGSCEYEWIAKGFTDDQMYAEGLERTMILQHYIKTGTCGLGHGNKKCA